MNEIIEMKDAEGNTLIIEGGQVYLLMAGEERNIGRIDCGILHTQRWDSKGHYFRKYASYGFCFMLFYYAWTKGWFSHCEMFVRKENGDTYGFIMPVGEMVKRCIVDSFGGFERQGFLTIDQMLQLKAERPQVA